MFADFEAGHRCGAKCCEKTDDGCRINEPREQIRLDQQGLDHHPSEVEAPSGNAVGHRWSSACKKSTLGATGKIYTRTFANPLGGEKVEDG